MKKIARTLLILLLIIVSVFTVDKKEKIYADELNENDYIYNLFTQSSLENVIGFSWGNEDIMVQVRSYEDSHGLNRAVFCIEPGNPTNLNTAYSESHTAPGLYKGGLDLDAANNVMMMWAYKHKGELNLSYAEFTAVQIAIWAAETGHNPSALAVRDGLSAQGIANANAVKNLAITLYNERNNSSWKGDIQLYNFTKDEYVTSASGLAINTDYTYEIGGVKYFKSDIYAYRTTGYASVDNISITAADDSDIKGIIVDTKDNVAIVYVPVSAVIGGSGTYYLKANVSCNWKKATPLYFDSDVSQAFMTPDVTNETKNTTLTLTVTKTPTAHTGTYGEISWNKVGFGPTGFTKTTNINETGETLYAINDWTETSLKGGKFSIFERDDTSAYTPLLTFRLSDGYVKYTNEDLNDDINKNVIGFGELEAPKGYIMSLNSAAAQDTTTASGERVILNAYQFDKTTAVSNVVTKNGGNPYKLTNEPKTVTVNVHKVDQNGDNVSGATYGLYTTEEIIIGGTYDIPTISIIPANSLIDIADTNSNGIATLGHNVPVVQNYVVREIKTPDGYDLNSTEYLVNLETFIADQTNTDDAKTKTVNIDAIDTKYTIGDINTNAYTTYIKDVVSYKGTKLKTVLKTTDMYDVYDTVTITNTSTGSYKLKGTIINKNTGAELYTTEKEFDIVNEDETIVEVKFSNTNFNSLNINDTIVVTEELYRLQYKWNPLTKAMESVYVKVKEHKDLTDVNQTLTVIGYGNIEIIKTNEAGNINLAGAKFQLIYKNESSLSEPTIIASATTGGDGKVVIPNVANGEYYLIETAAPTGYIKSSTPFEVVLNVMDNGVTTVSKTIKNKQSDYVVNLTKHDSADTNIFVAGAKYGLYNNATSHLDETGITDVNGKINFSNLVHGVTYYVKEITPPSGYEINNTKYTFTVDATTFVTDPLSGIKTYEIVTADPKESTDGAILIKKVNDSGSPLKNALFYIYDNINNAKSLSTPVTVGLSNNSGEILIKNLPAGSTYYIVEAEAPSGYERNTTIFTANITSKNTTVITIKNTKKSTPKNTTEKIEDKIKVVNTSVKKH